jgi:ribosomal protein S18 acetylase RimI-like enzyme
MEVEISLAKIADLSAGERTEIRDLSRAIYPPEEIEDWPGRHIEWAQFEWCARVRGEEGKLVSYVGILVREASLGGTPRLVGGIGGVGTHPAARRRGYAKAGIREAINFFREGVEVDFALLVCRPELIKYYFRLGWREFDGQLLVLQHGKLVDFTFNRVMTLGVRSKAPLTGSIDLGGLPW